MLPIDSQTRSKSSKERLNHSEKILCDENLKNDSNQVCRIVAQASCSSSSRLTTCDLFQTDEKQETDGPPVTSPAKIKKKRVKDEKSDKNQQSGKKRKKQSSEHDEPEKNKKIKKDVEGEEERKKKEKVKKEDKKDESDKWKWYVFTLLSFR